MDRNNTPSALDAELFEKGGCDDGFGRGESIRVEESTADDGDEDYTEATTEDLGGVANYGAAGHGAEIGDHLGYGYGVGGEVVLVGQHRWVEILRAVRHEIESSHEEKLYWLVNIVG